MRGGGTTDQAFQLTYTVPVDATGWTWWDYARGSRVIGEGTHTVVMERNRMHLFREVQLFMDDAR